MALRAAGRHDGLLSERVVLVDPHDRELGTEDKLRAHQTGALHRAVSAFLFDEQGQLLLQRRAAGKYHSAGKWSNTCCSHPRPGETPLAAATRRLTEEMGVSCELTPAFSFVYRAALDNGLVEHELDHVFTGTFEGKPVPDPLEVQDWKWMPLGVVAADCREHSDRYSAWLAPALAEFSRRGLP